MVVEGGAGDGEWEGRWNHIQKFLERPGPFTHPDFEASSEVMVYAKCIYENCSWFDTVMVWRYHLLFALPFPQSLQFMLETCKVLIIGAGGLGCELLKDVVWLAAQWNSIVTSTCCILLTYSKIHVMNINIFPHSVLWVRLCQGFTTSMLLTWTQLTYPTSTDSFCSGQ